MNRLHIVHVIGTPKSGGVQTNLLNMVRSNALNEFWHSIVCIIDDQGELRQSYESAGVQVHSCPVRWPPVQFTPSYRADHFLRDHLYFSIPWRFSSLLTKINADLVHTHITTHVGWQASAVLNYTKIPWIWTLHGLYRSRGEDTSEWNKAIRLVNRKRAMVTAVSQSALNELTSHEHLLPSKQKIIFNGIEIKLFSVDEMSRHKMRERLKISPDALVFGTAGRLIHVKRHDLLIKAAASVLHNGLDAYILIAGEGPMYDQLHKLCMELGVSDRVHLLGYQKNINDLLSALDVFILPSDSEALPLALIEACAVGLPCIATSVGGVPDVLGDSGGILIQPGSPVALADAMEKMLSPHTRGNYASRARAVAEKFSSAKTCREYASLYQHLLQAL